MRRTRPVQNWSPRHSVENLISPRQCFASPVHQEACEFERRPDHVPLFADQNPVLNRAVDQRDTLIRKSLELPDPNRFVVACNDAPRIAGHTTPQRRY